MIRMHVFHTYVLRTYASTVYGVILSSLEEHAVEPSWKYCLSINYAKLTQAQYLFTLSGRCCLISFILNSLPKAVAYLQI